MKDFVITCCSACDLTSERLNKKGIEFLPFHYFINDSEYQDDMYSTISPQEFYSSIRKAKSLKTAQINAQEYVEFFTKFAKRGVAVVHVCLSSGISGSFNSALIAKNTIKQEYPNFELYVVDSLCASSGYGLLVDMLAQKKAEGVSAKELYEYAQNIKLQIRHEFCSYDLSFYIKGGRVSKTAGTIGNILKICPVLDMSVDGKLVVRKKAMGKSKALNELIAKMQACAKSGLDYDGLCYISHSDEEQEAIKLKEMVEAKFDELVGRVKIFNIGSTIGCHSGPGTIALFYVGSKREN